MLKEILEVGGSGYFIPALLLICSLYVVRGIFGLNGRRSQHRREFLELWDDAQSKDDLWLEVAIRHLFGTFVPARFIRLALSQPDKSQALRDLSELWPLLQFEGASHAATWRSRWHRSRRRRTIQRRLLIASYFLLPFIAIASALIAIQFPTTSFSSWIYWVNAGLFLVVAFICLEKAETVGIAEHVGDEWLARINGCAVNENTPSTHRPAARTE
ncbi:hypothetical protein J2X04_002839 [Lysobacter niabensis]|uniref:Uncharacterized protein n=1 Tax=Agrilutibacter niabensis TaxID=380628 RepID=A0ABU1VSJ9_9GAMM|nr:hypothetical protein [Lysobacter niabensis]MDR7100458.1 hypothetical protein [Lysobacter niabensis]